MAHTSPAYTGRFALVAINLEDENEIQEMVRQRKICGWNHERETLAKWNQQIVRGVKFMWWIVIYNPSTDSSDTGTSTHNNNTPEGAKAGHIALAAESYPPTPELAQMDRSILTVSTFFILPEYRKGGLGRAAWFEAERKAAEIPECRQIAIDTLDRRYIVIDSPEWSGVGPRNGFEWKTGMITEDWYTRMGYEKFKTVPGRYPIDNSEERLTSVFLRKNIK